MNETVILAGVEAWGRLRDAGRRSWSDWKCVGAAIALGRAESMKVAGINRPFGTRYRKAMKEFLAKHGLDDIEQQVRYRILQCMDHLPKIETWRATVPEAKRQRLNHPDSVWFGYQGVSRKPGPRQRAKRTTQTKLGPAPMGDVIRLVATTLRETNSRDYFVMASAVLRALDAAGLMARPDQTKTTTRPAETPIAAAVVHAA